MSDIFKKIFGVKKNEKTLLNERPAQNTITLVEARRQLYNARRKNILVIDIELRRLRNPQIMSEEAIERSRQRVKNAYYALNVIKWVEDTMLEMSINNQLAQGMNRITEAVKLINKFDSKDEKPKTLRFKTATSKLGRSNAKVGSVLDKMESAYDEALPIDAAVEDDIVEKLINCDSIVEIKNYADSSTGIRVPYSDQLNIDFSNFDDLVGDESELDFNDDIVFSDDDLSDLNL